MNLPTGYEAFNHNSSNNNRPVASSDVAVKDFIAPPTSVSEAATLTPLPDASTEVYSNIQSSNVNNNYGLESSRIRE